MKETVHTISIGGWRWEYRHVDAVVPVFTLFLRLAFGFFFLWSGFDKLITDFTAKGFLLNATGPLKDLFVRMGESQAALDVIDPLVVYGQILIGFALFFGLFTRFALSMAATQMFLFYLPTLRPAHNPFLDEHIFYILIFALLGALGAGRVFGLDGVLERWTPVRRIRSLGYALAWSRCPSLLGYGSLLRRVASGPKFGHEGRAPPARSPRPGSGRRSASTGSLRSRP